MTKIDKLAPKEQVEYLIVNILDHCNLRCKGCDHFACIAEPYYVSAQTIRRDMEQMAIICGDKIQRIGVMGGEPLLHPDLLIILEYIRNSFPNSVIRLTTNGILLLRQNDKFWKTLRELNIVIVNTRYPINLDFEGMRRKALEENVSFMHFENTSDINVKRLFKKNIDSEGRSDITESFLKCHISNYGNFLMEGKLYGCPFSCQSQRIFCRKFNIDLRMTSSDYLDIYNIRSIDEILDFAAAPHNYCRYCTGRSSTFEWERSKGDIREWI